MTTSTGEAATIAEAVRQAEQWVAQLRQQALALRGQLAEARQALHDTERQLAHHEGRLTALRAVQQHVTDLEQAAKRATPDA